MLRTISMLIVTPENRTTPKKNIGLIANAGPNKEPNIHSGVENRVHPVGES